MTAETLKVLSHHPFRSAIGLGKFSRRYSVSAEK